MANEIVWTYASQVTLESAGASFASNGFLAATTADIASAGHSNFPLCDFAIYIDFRGAVNGTSVVKLYRQDLNIQSTNDSPAPAATYQYKYIGSFVIQSGVGGQSSPLYYPLTDIPIKKDQQYAIENKSNQSVDTGWKLYATPKTYEPAT